MEEEVPVREDASGGDLSPYTAYVGTRYLRTVVLERFGEAGVNEREQRLRTFLAHARRGGVFGFSRDHARSVAGIVASPVAEAETVTHSGNGFRQWSSSAELDAGDEVVLESADPEWNYQVTTASAVSGRVVTLADPVVFDHGDWALLRWRGFSPVCFLPTSTWAQQPVVSVEAEVGWTLRLTFEYFPALTMACWGRRSMKTSFSGPTVGGGWSGDRPLSSLGLASEVGEPDLQSLGGLVRPDRLRPGRDWSSTALGPRQWR